MSSASISNFSSPIEVWGPGPKSRLRNDVITFGAGAADAPQEPLVLRLPISREALQNTPAVREALARIERLATLEENWDQEDAAAIAPEALIVARSLVLQYVDEGIEPEFVVPGRNGEVIIEYHGKQGKSASIVVLSKENTRLVTYEGANATSKVRFSMDDIREALGHSSKKAGNSFLRRLFSQGR